MRGDGHDHARLDGALVGGIAPGGVHVAGVAAEVADAGVGEDVGHPCGAVAGAGGGRGVAATQDGARRGAAVGARGLGSRCGFGGRGSFGCSLGLGDELLVVLLGEGLHLLVEARKQAVGVVLTLQHLGELVFLLGLQVLELGELGLELSLPGLELRLGVFDLGDELGLGVAHLVEVVDVAEQLLEVGRVEHHVDGRGGAVLVAVRHVGGELFLFGGKLGLRGLDLLLGLADLDVLGLDGAQRRVELLAELLVLPGKLVNLGLHGLVLRLRVGQGGRGCLFGARRAGRQAGTAAEHGGIAGKGCELAARKQSH